MICYHEENQEEQENFQMILNRKLTCLIIQQHFAIIQL